MKIDSSTKTSNAPLIKESTGRYTEKAVSTNGDDVQLSILATQLRASDDEQSFDTARVSEIKQAIRDGSFKINSGAIADRLITSAQELLDSQRQA